MKKFFLLGAVAVLSAFTAHSQCTTGGTLFGSANAPCSAAGTVSANIAGFEVWRGDLYEIDDVQAGASYSVDICQGTGGTAWTASLTVVAPSGAIDAFGTDGGSPCELSFVASESGTYQMFVNEVGECPGVSQDVDNGSPRVTYFSGGTCPDPVTTCDAGALGAATVDAAVCPFEIYPYDAIGVTIPNSPLAGDFRILFQPVAGLGSGGPFGAEPDPSFNLTFTTPAGSENVDILAGIDNVLTTAGGGFPPLLGDWTITGFVSNGTTDCDSLPPVTVDFLTSADAACIPVTTCEAGVVDQAAVDNELCPDETTDYILTGFTIPNSPVVGEYIVEFTPVAGSGSGGPFGAEPDPAFFLTLNTPAGTENADATVTLGATLFDAVGEDLPALLGEWSIRGAILTGAVLCDSVPAVVIDFKTDTDPACGGPVPCALPYPAVPNASLGVVQNPNGSITFSWAPINGQIGCQINARVGDIATPTVQTSIIVPGAGASSFTASQFALAPYPFTTINFRVRCGCQNNPTVIAGNYSGFVSILNIPPAASSIVVNTDLLVKRELVRSDNNMLLIEAQTMDTWAPVYNNPALTTGSVSKMSSAVKKASFDVFPNPTSGSVNLNYAATAEGMVNVRVFDLVGKAVADYNMAVNEGENFLNLDLSSFEKGIYVVQVLDGQVSSTAKVVLK